MVLFLGCLTDAASPAKHRSAFSLSVNELTDDLRIRSVFVMPNEPIRIAARSDQQSSVFQIKTSLTVTGQAAQQWRVQAPATPGIHVCTVRCAAPPDSVQLNIFVLTPYDNSGVMAGYKIGRYPSGLAQTWTARKAPAGFVQVTKENEGVYLSPRFTLMQFLCKQPGAYPKFLAVQEKLVLKLELILDKLEEKGFSCNTLAIMSGFRTPWYNANLGNPANSQHCWGSAADIYVDNDDNGAMDDLNRDGRCDLTDSRLLHSWIEEWGHEPIFASLLGGLAHYRHTRSHGPFVHVDVRGFSIGWGD